LPPADERRVVSLLPSATEIVAALGLADALVGRSHECDFPTGVSPLPVCTEPLVDPSAPSREIHRSVSDLLARALSVYRVDAERLRALRPTHVVTQVQCEVCAVSLVQVRDALADWTREAPELVALNPCSLDDVFADILRVATALGVSRRGEELVASMRGRLAAIADAARLAPERPRVATVEWLSPLMAAGNWMPELVQIAGGENVLGEAGRHSPRLEWPDLAAADPDAIVVFPCGFSLERTERESGLLAALPGWADLRAVRAGRVYLCEANQFFNRPGPRLVETAEILAEILHPSRFSFGHEGMGWTRMTGSGPASNGGT
jgi:iron complex transport system substrate-binding protein